MHSSKSTLRYLMLSMLCGSCVVVCLAPYVLATFLRDYQTAPDTIAFFQIFLQGALLFVLLGAVVLRDCSARNATIRGLLIARLPLLSLPLLTFFQPDWMIGGVMMLCVFASVTGAFISGSLDVWFRQIIPARILGSFLGRRLALCFVCMAVLTPAIGYWLEHPEASGLNRDGVYTVIFSLAALFGLGDIIFLTFCRKPDLPKPESDPEQRDRLSKIVRTPGFWRVALFAVLPVVSLLLVSPYSLQILYDFQLDRFQVGALTAAGTFALGLGTIVGGRSSDRAPGRNASRNLPLAFGISGLQALILLLLLLTGWHVLTSSFLFVLLLPLSVCTAFLQGISTSLSLRMIFDSVRGGSTLSFGFIRFLQGAFAVGVSSVSACLGSGLIASTGWLQAHLWAGFHYGYALYALATLLGLTAAVALRGFVRAHGTVRPQLTGKSEEATSAEAAA